MRNNKILSLWIVFLFYCLAIVAAYCSIQYLNLSSLIEIFIADIVATCIIYFSSYIFKNSSLYDPYWSVIPSFLLLYWIYDINETFNTQSIIVLFSVLFWGARLTFNWARGWKGLIQEDWRYIDMRNYSGKWFEFSNFLGIHLFPTLIVFVCCIPMKNAIQKNVFDISFIIGFIVCFIGVLYEIISDQQLYNFKNKNKTGMIESGLWKYSRHPNYYGEILFWWGVFIYGVNINNYLLLILAPISMTIMFLYVSIPWIENKISRTRPEYKSYQEKVSMLFPELTIIKNIFK